MTVSSCGKCGNYCGAIITAWLGLPLRSIVQGEAGDGNELRRWVCGAIKPQVEDKGRQDET